MSDIIERLDNSEMCVDAVDDAISEIKSIRAELAQVKAERDVALLKLENIHDIVDEYLSSDGVIEIKNRKNKLVV